MNFQGTMANCPSCNQQMQQPTSCCNVVQTCNVEEIPHYTNYHTHVVNNCIKRHINIPTYSSDSETVVINEYVNGNPIYLEPNYQQGVGYQGNPYLQQQPMQGNYQGNVATTPYGFNPYNY